MSNNATICPKDYCRALIPATGTDRAAHLAGHASDEKAARAMRAELLTIRDLIAELKDDNREFRAEMKTFRTEAPTEALTIEEWPEDELPDDQDELDTSDDGHDPHEALNVNSEDDIIREYPLSIDRPGEDDDLDTRLANATGQQPTI